MNAIAQNWKTTAIGVFTAVAGYVAMFPTGFPDNAVNIAKYVQVGGLASLGLVAKDAKKGDDLDA